MDTIAAALGQIDTWDVPAGAAAVVGPDGILASRGDLHREFALASVTKLVFAAAVLVAHEERSVDLDEPAGPPGSTVRHLLAHASGLPFEGSVPLGPPATTRIYSNRGYEILGDVLAAGTAMTAAEYLHEAVVEALGMTATELRGSPAYAAVSCAADLALLAAALLAPGMILAPATVEAARTVQFPGLRGIVPGFGMQGANDWGLGPEIRDAKRPHWTGSRNSPATFGHFGRSGTFVWVDPGARCALVCLTDREFDEWAKDAWPRLSDAVLACLPAGPSAHPLERNIPGG